MSYICPSCGAPYNGKRCRNCLYENFTEEIGHGNHTHKGEPLVIEAPERKLIPRQDPFDCPPKPPRQSSFQVRKSGKKGLKRALLIPFIVVLLFSVVVPRIANLIITNAVSQFTDHTESGRIRDDAALSDSPAAASPETDPAQDFKVSMVLYSDENYSIVTDWQDGQTPDPENGILMQVENRTQQDILVSATEVTVNGWMLNDAFFYCYPDKESTSLDTLEFDAEELALCGIDTIESLSFRLQIHNAETYDTLLETDTIVLLPQQAAESSFDSHPLPGASLYQDSSVAASFLSYRAASYAPDSIFDGNLLFCLENCSDSALAVYAEKCEVNGETIYLSMYNALPAHTRTMARMYLFDLEDTNIKELEDIRSFQLSLTIYDDASDEAITTKMLDVPLTQ